MTDEPTPIADPPSWLCRCEEVTPAEVRAAVAAGARTLNDVKRRTRAGMGPCQAVYCQPALAALLAAEVGIPPDRVVPITGRPPARPIPLEHLAKATD